MLHPTLSRFLPIVQTRWLQTSCWWQWRKCCCTCHPHRQSLLCHPITVFSLSVGCTACYEVPRFRLQRHQWIATGVWTVHPTGSTNLYGGLSQSIALPWRRHIFDLNRCKLPAGNFPDLKVILLSAVAQAVGLPGSVGLCPFILVFHSSSLAAVETHLTGTRPYRIWYRTFGILLQKRERLWPYCKPPSVGIKDAFKDRECKKALLGE